MVMLDTLRQGTLWISKIPNWKFFVFKKEMTNELVNRLIRRTFRIENTEDILANSGILEARYIYPEYIILQHLAVKRS